MIKNKSLIVCVSFLAVTTLASCSDEAAEPVKKTMVRPVKLITVGEVSDTEHYSYPAVVKAAQSSDLSFQVGGLLELISVREAHQVNQGEVIARLDQRDYKSKVDSARAQFENAEAEYQRAVRLEKEDAIAKNVLEQRKSQRDVARAALDSATKALADTVLKAPFSGVVANVPVEQLQTIKPGELVATLIAEGVLEASINLPASVIATTESRKNKMAFVELDVAPEKKIRAEFKSAVLEADAISQTYEVSFSFVPPDGLIILPGMNATMILTSTPANAVDNHDVSVPLASVMSEGGQQFVWIVNDESMIVSKRKVSIKEGIGETVVVTGGLESGETIVAAGAAYLAEGIKVRPWSD